MTSMSAKLLSASWDMENFYCEKYPSLDVLLLVLRISFLKGGFRAKLGNLHSSVIYCSSMLLYRKSQGKKKEFFKISTERRLSLKVLQLAVWII